MMLVFDEDYLKSNHCIINLNKTKSGRDNQIINACSIASK